MRYREQSVQPQLPLFQLCSVKAKMCKFDANMTTLDTPVCTICSERFSGLQLHFKSTECSRDKRIPKLYSSASNMNPHLNCRLATLKHIHVSTLTAEITPMDITSFSGVVSVFPRILIQCSIAREQNVLNYIVKPCCHLIYTYKWYKSLFARTRPALRVLAFLYTCHT